MFELKRILEQSSGIRAYSIRVGLLKKTKRYFSKNYNILSNTIKQYEESNISKSESTGQKLYDAFCQEAKIKGITISENWFFEGHGEGPIDDEVYSKIFYEVEDTESRSYADTLLFKARYKDADVFTLEDNDNIPYYNPSDCVGFIWRKLSQVSELYKIACVIELNNKLIVRFCTKISNNKIRIECNTEIKIIQVDKIAPIIYHRLGKRYRLINIEGPLFG